MSMDAGPAKPYDLCFAQEFRKKRFDSRRFVLGGIFVNYRRNDSEGEAGRLFDELEKDFGEHSVFMDVTAIEPGQDFRKAIDQSVAACSVLLAVIGPQWIDSRDASGVRRLDDPGDFVRSELASALRRNIPVLPVLVRGARMPRSEELTDELKELAYRNAVELTHARWKSDIQLLIRALRPYMGRAVTENPAIESRPADARVAVPAQQRAPASGVANVPAEDSIDPQTLDKLSRELARYLGPIANVIVKRAAQRGASLDQLCTALGREIVSDADRARFLRTVRN